MSEQTEIKKKKAGSRVYPKFTLNAALKIAESIRDNNNLQPFDRITLAKSLDNSPSSSSFRQLITASTSYGLTKGSYAAEKITLTPLGTSIVSPTTDDEQSESVKKALFNVNFFKKFYSKFNNGKIPRKDLLLNTLHREFDIPVSSTEQCYNILIKNAKELGLITMIKEAEYIQLNKISTSIKGKKLPTDIPEIDKGPLGTDEDSVDITPPYDSTDSQDQQFRPKVFIGHSKNKKILNQLKDILEFGQFDYVVAEETETSAIPISEKVFGLMKDCNCAIINLSADEQEKDGESFRINQNVLTEIGAAFLKYNKKVILLTDKRLVVTLPSNIQGLVRCDYEGNELSFNTAMKLQKSLTNFR